MRVFMLGLMFAIAALMPSAANADDQQIADFIKARLMQEKQQGNLFGFNVDMRVDRGTVWFKGFVSNRAQELMILRTAQLAGHLGVVQVVDDIEVNGPNNMVQQQPIQMQRQPMQQPMPPQRMAMRPDAYQQGPMPMQGAEMMRRSMPQPQMTRPQMPKGVPSARQATGPFNAPAGVPLSENTPKTDENTKRVAYQEPISAPYRQGIPQVPASVPSFQQSLLNPVQGQTVATPINRVAPPAPTPITGSPLPFARAAAAPQGCFSGNCGGGAPMAGGGYYDGGAGGISSDSASLPGYAWPSYAAHPNYGAVSYPKQYSASAWPYIGPFYPYPQVPLGWRKVSLEWDDGWWFLDFNDKDR